MPAKVPRESKTQGTAPIAIPEELLEAMILHARAEEPLECCGFLTGRRGRIESIVPATNELRSKTAFSVAPDELFSFFRSLRRSGKQLLGIYHSHPRSSPVPSPKDIREFHYPGVSYWIISLAGGEPESRCYRWRDRGFEEVPYTCKA